MYGMGLVLPIALGILVLVLFLASIVGGILVFAGPAILIVAFTVFLCMKLDFKRHLVRSGFALLLSLGAYAYCFNLAIYFIYWKEHTLPLGRPFLNPFGPAGIATAIIGFIVCAIVAYPGPWKRFANDQGAVVSIVPVALIINTIVFWPILAIVLPASGVVMKNTPGSQYWWWGWFLTIPIIVIIQMLEPPLEE